MPNSKKKICFITDTLNAKSGWGRLSLEVIDGIKKSGNCEPVVLTRKNSGYPGERVLIRLGFWGIIVSSIKARKFVRDSDIVHAIDGWPYSVIAWLANFFYGRPFFITAVGTYSVLPLDRFLQKFLLRLAYRGAEKIFSISTYTKKEILKRTSLDNIEVVNLGVDFNKFNSVYVPSVFKKNVLLSAGAVKGRKGYHVALEAFFILKKKYPDLKYIIAGSFDADSNYFKYLKEIISGHNGQESVFFAGDIGEDDLLECYRKAKIFILPSINTGGAFEGFGLVLLEANAAGIPVIGTTSSGMEDIITNGMNGFLVSQNDSAELVSAIEKILSDSGLCSELKEGALKCAKEMSWTKTIEKYKNAYGN